MERVIRTTASRTRRLARPRPEWLPFGANAVVLVGLLVLLFTVQANTPSLHVGAIAGETLLAPRAATYRDHAATATRKQRALSAVPTQYKTDTTRAKQRLSELPAFLARGQTIAGTSVPPAEKVAGMRAALPPGMLSAAIQQLADLKPQDFPVVRERSRALLLQGMGWRFAANQLQTTELGLLAAVPARVSALQRTTIGEILATFLAPTLVTDVPATERKQRQAEDRVPQVTNKVQAGEIVVRRGDVITPSVMEKLDALGLQSTGSGWRDVASALLFSAVIIAMLFWYLNAFHREVLTNRRLLLLLDGIVLLAVASARIFASGHVLLPFFLPVAAAPTFAAVLIAPEASLAIAFAVSVLAGWIVANSFELTTYYFVTSAAGILAIRHVRQVKQFMLAGVYIMLFAAGTSLAFGLLDHNYDFAGFREHLAAAMFNGFVSSALALGAFAVLSDFFGVTSNFQLMELAQPSQRLLRRLMIKAPGTYNHSLIVANMVEQAAEEMGADSLVAKLGALYHDVGKTINPHCFVENQLGIGNIHDELRPEESARIIKGHVGQGLRLARQHRLPRAIVDAIAQHHGTMTIAYFLHKAKQEDQSGEEVNQSPYTYSGPKPQSKETGLLMLADACESTVRSTRDHSNDKIRDLVEQTFEDRIHGGQLDESPLTLGDLERAKEAFCSVLTGLYHPRIEYPEAAELPLPVIPPLSLAETDVPLVERQRAT